MFNSDEDMRRSDAENKNENDVTKKNPEPDVREGDSPVAQANPEKTKKKPRTVTVGKAVLMAVLSVVIAVTVSVQASFVMLGN